MEEEEGVERGGQPGPGVTSRGTPSTPPLAPRLPARPPPTVALAPEPSSTRAPSRSRTNWMAVWSTKLRCQPYVGSCDSSGWKPPPAMGLAARASAHVAGCTPASAVGEPLASTGCAGGLAPAAGAASLGSRRAAAKLAVIEGGGTCGRCDGTCRPARPAPSGTLRSGPSGSMPPSVLASDEGAMPGLHPDELGCSCSSRDPPSRSSLLKPPPLPPGAPLQLRHAATAASGPSFGLLPDASDAVLLLEACGARRASRGGKSRARGRHMPCSRRQHGCISNIPAALALLLHSHLSRLVVLHHTAPPLPPPPNQDVRGAPGQHACEAARADHDARDRSAAEPAAAAGGRALLFVQHCIQVDVGVLNLQRARPRPALEKAHGLACRRYRAAAGPGWQAGDSQQRCMPLPVQPQHPSADRPSPGPG